MQSHIVWFANPFTNFFKVRWGLCLNHTWLIFIPQARFTSQPLLAFFVRHFQQMTLHCDVSVWHIILVIRPPPPNIFPQVDLAVPLRGVDHPGLIIYPDSGAHPLPSPGSHLDCLPPTSENNAMSTSSKTDPNTNLLETFQAQYISENPVAFLHQFLTIAFVMEY